MKFYNKITINNRNNINSLFNIILIYDKLDLIVKKKKIF